MSFLDGFQVYKILGPINDEGMEEFEDVLKGYVGHCALTKKDGKPYGMALRLKDHINSSNKKSASMAPMLANAMELFGWENFRILPIEFCTTKKEALQREAHWISELDTVHPCGYNLLSGDATSGKFNHHEESKTKMREKQINQPRPNKVKRKFSIDDSLPTLVVRYDDGKGAVGYRATFNKQQKVFVGSQFSMEAKLEMALRWRYLGQAENGNLPCARLHDGPNGEKIEEAGVKAVTGGFRAYHPTRKGIRQPKFSILSDAIAYAKKVKALPLDEPIPDDLASTPQAVRPIILDNIRDKKLKSTGTHTGYEVNIPPHKSITGKQITKCIAVQSKSLDQNKKEAIEYRNSHLKKSFMIDEYKL